MRTPPDVLAVQEVQTSTVFGVGMDLPAAASQITDANRRDRLEGCVADLDRALRELRQALFAHRGV
jgi:hypothetical protein